jgi:glycosyltransferase involved in cell wall biosynthesis
LQRKGFQELIQAFAQVHALHPEAKLSIYGDGEYCKALLQLVAELGLSASVSLPGKHPRVHEKLDEADCFVFPSWYEGFSGALVEAMLSGIPIIASDIPMNLEAVSHEVNALVFPVKNTEALTQCMLRAIAEPELMLQLGQKAREEAINRFDIEQIARQYEAVLQQVYQNTRLK